MKKVLFLLVMVILLIACANEPRLTAADIHMNYTNKGFSLTKNLKSNPCTYSCTKSDTEYMMRVDFSGKPSDIRNFSATGQYYDDKQEQMIKDFIAYSASIPYPNSNPREAKDFVERNIQGGDTIIGPAKIEVFHKGKTYKINIDINYK